MGKFLDDLFDNIMPWFIRLYFLCCIGLFIALVIIGGHYLVEAVF